MQRAPTDAVLDNFWNTQNSVFFHTFFKLNFIFKNGVVLYHFIIWTVTHAYLLYKTNGYFSQKLQNLKILDSIETPLSTLTLWLISKIRSFWLVTLRYRRPRWSPANFLKYDKFLILVHTSQVLPPMAFIEIPEHQILINFGIKSANYPLKS